MEQINRTNEEMEISLTDILYSLWDFKWIIIILTLLGAVIGALIPAGQGPSYQTKASMLVTAAYADGTYRNGTANPQSEDIYLSQNLTKTVKLLSTSSRVLRQVISEEEFSGILPEDLKNSIEVSAEDGTSFLWLTLSWYDDEQAVRLLNRLMEVLPCVMTQVMDIGSVNVIDMAENAVMIRGESPRTGILGAVIGLAMGCVGGVAYYLFLPKVRGSESLAQLNLDVLGDIPQLSGEAKGYLDEEGLPLKYQEAYGRLSAVLRYATRTNGLRILGITSGAPGEGKSTVTYNLAVKLTEVGHKVLLLDFDFKKGSLYQLVKTRKPKDGDIREELRNGENLEHLIEMTFNGIYTIQGFSEKDIFQVDNDIYSALRSMKSRFDYILIDTPSVGTLSDVLQMNELLEGILLVVRQDKAAMKDVAEAAARLEHTGIPVLGCILNGKK